MKKIVSISLLLTYLAFSIGINLSKHYCGGKLISVKLSSQQEKSCSMCGGKPMKGCCKDISSCFKIDNDHQHSAKTAIDLPAFSINFNHIFPEFQLSSLWSNVVVICYDFNPDIPKWNNDKITFFCTYLI